jgi:cellulose synthase/poly-beta-1,6-N-acetylglucosamine synthase-like glycosyltransferase
MFMEFLGTILSTFSSMVGGVLLFSILVFALAISLFWAYGVHRWATNRSILNRELPSISVIVVGRNEEIFISKCLKSLLNLDYPGDLIEICFVDDHSEDNTYAIACSIAENSSKQLKVFRAPPCPTGYSPKKHALAFAVSKTSGKFFLLTDADNQVSPGWAKAMVASFDESTGAVAGISLPPRSTSLFQILYRLERLLVNYTSLSAIGWGSPASVCGQSLAYRRSAFEQLGEFAHPEVPSGDDDLTVQALARKNWKIGFCRYSGSLVDDLRPPTIHRELNAAVRHQSTVSFYPLQWRAIYFLTICSYLLLVLLSLISFFRPLNYLIISGFGVLKTLIEGFTLIEMKRHLRFELSLLELLLIEFVLPIYVVFKPILLLFPRFSWHDRMHKNSPPLVGKIAK